MTYGRRFLFTPEGAHGWDGFKGTDLKGVKQGGSVPTLSPAAYIAWVYVPIHFPGVDLIGPSRVSPT